MSKPDTTDDVPINPAATVILLRDDVQAGMQALLLKRNSKLDFAGGSWVFPGGRFEPADFAAAGSQDEHLAAPYAAAREALEETGLTLDPSDFQYHAHWTTPRARMPKRFATWFFVCAWPHDASVSVDGSEIHDHLWASPADALGRHSAREIELMPPTFVCLTELAEFGSADQAVAELGRREAFVYNPRFTKLDGDVIALYEGDAGYESVDASLPGARHRCVMHREQAWELQRELS